MVVYHAWVLTGGPALGGGRVVLSGGFLAVALFFVLSAFVLTLPAARTGDFGAWREYTLRRGARVVPAPHPPPAGAPLPFTPPPAPPPPRAPPAARPPPRRAPPARRGVARAPELPAGGGAAPPRLRGGAGLSRGPAAVDAVGRGRLLRGAAAARPRLPAAAGAVALRRPCRDRRA